MTDTWGIPGPAFAGLYLGLLLLPALVGVVRAGRLRRGRAGGAPQRPEELAVLTGGRRRFGEYVVASLLDQQIVRLGGNGWLSRVKGSAADTVGREALSRIGKHGSSVERVCDAAAAHKTALELETALIGRGLVTDPRKVRATWVATAVAYWLVLAFGVVRLVAGANTGHPVGILVGLLAVGTVVAIAVTVKARHEPAVKATATGKAAAEAAREAGTLTAGAAGTVAAYGLSGHPDKAIRQAATQAARHSAARAAVHRARRTRFAGIGGGAGGGAAVGYYGGGSCGGGGSSCGGGGSSCGGGGGGCGG